MEGKWSDEREKWERAKRRKKKGERENLTLYVLELTYLIRKHMQRNEALSPYVEPRQ
jgi:hypothetical protein